MRTTLLTALAAALLSACSGLSTEGVEWGYEGAGAPGNWGRLSPEFSACGVGRNQSPVNLTGAIRAQLEPLSPAYRAGGRDIVNNGHTIQIGFAPGSQLIFNGEPFELKQLHFHAPSENHIDGQSYALENHLVHADKDGNLLVLAILYEEGPENAGLSAFWDQSPQEIGDKTVLDVPVNAASLLPGKLDYYRFNGSLTTPPCSEGVYWLVLKQPLTASPEQVGAFSALMGGPNNRPLQPVNARPVLQ